MRTADKAQILLKCHDGFIMIMQYIFREYRMHEGQEIIAWERGTTDSEIEAEIQKAAPSFPPERLPIISWRFIIPEELPEDRTFRNAWHDPNDGMVQVHMGRARDIHRNILREYRACLLDSLDKEYLKADEKKDTKWKKTIAQKKQQLRDITIHPAIDAAATPEELKLLTLEALSNPTL